MPFNSISHLITRGTAGISIMDISAALDVSIEEYSLKSLVRRPEVNIWSKRKPVSSTVDSMLVEQDFRDVKYGLNIPSTSATFNYVNVREWSGTYRNDWTRASITDKNYRISDWDNYYTEAKPPITIVDMSTFVDASTAWVMMSDGVSENYADISVQVPSANSNQISLSDLQFPLGSGGNDSYLSNCHLVALCLCEDSFTENPYTNGIGTNEVSRVFINPKKLTESGGLRMYIPASLSYTQGALYYQNMTVIPMIGVEPMRLPRSSDNATIFYQTTKSGENVDYEHARNVPSQLVPIPKTKGGYMAWHYKAPYGGKQVPKLYSMINDSNVRWSVDSSVWYGDFGASATKKHVHMNPYWYTENFSVRSEEITNHTLYVSCSVFNPNSTISGVTDSSIRYSVNGGSDRALAALVDDSFNTISNISFSYGSSNRIYMKLNGVTLPRDTEVPIRFTADDGSGRYVHVGTLYFRGEQDFVAEMGVDKILDVSVFVDDIPASGGSVRRADIYYTFDKETTRRHYVFTDFLVEAESLGTTLSPLKRQIQLVNYIIRDSGQIYSSRFWVEQEANVIVKEEFIIDEHSIQQFKGNGEMYFSLFDSTAHSKAFYIKVFVNGYVRNTYTSGSVKNSDMQYDVLKTSDAVFRFYQDNQYGVAQELPSDAWVRLGEYSNDSQYVTIDRNPTFYDRSAVLKVTYNSQTVSYNFTQSASKLPLRIDRVYIETNANSDIVIDYTNNALFNNNIGAFSNDYSPLYTDKGMYTYNFKLSIRLNGSEFASDNGGNGIDLKEYSIWFEFRKSDGSTYRVKMALKGSYDHYYISRTQPVDIEFDAYTDDATSDTRIFYQLFSEYYSDMNWIATSEIKKEVSWKLYLDTVSGATPNLTAQMEGLSLWLSSNDGRQSYTRA